MSDTKDFTIPKDRADLALHVAYEISELTRVIGREIDSDDTAASEYLLPMLLRRLHEINSVAMSVLGSDDGRPTEEMHKVIHG